MSVATALPRSVGANGTRRGRLAPSAQALPHGDVLARIDLIRDFAGSDVGRPDVLVDQMVLSRQQPAALDRSLVTGVGDHPVSTCSVIFSGTLR